MLKSSKATVGAVALALGSLSLLCAADGADRVQRAGVKAAKLAERALDRRDAAGAIAAAEQAVTLAPRVAAYRMLLGQGYLRSGRFRSAGEAFADVLTLDAGNGRAALNLALTQIAAGDWQTARGTLTRYATVIPDADRGLAMALAGDTAGAVGVLTQVARSPQTGPKVRQNLALAYALAGQWGVARMVAAVDMSPAELDARMQQWAAFAQPRAASDQVAGLLGVPVAADAGQPAALALSPATPSPTSPAVALAAAPAPGPVAAAPSAAEPVPPSPRIAFAPPQEVVQPLAPTAPVSTPARTVAPRSVARATPRAVATRAAVPGNWYVQLGAFEQAGVARDAWGRATHRFAAFKGQRPQGMTFRAGNTSFYRLSVGGFSRGAADAACRQYRARGGFCFVRLGAGDQAAQWPKAAAEIAAR